METSQAKTVVHSGFGKALTRPLRLVDRLVKASLSQESQRALSLFRAVNLTGDAAAAQTLISFAGREGEAVVSEGECQSLAAGLRDRGYPLTDGGIKRFKMERGFSEAVRIGPD